MGTSVTPQTGHAKAVVNGTVVAETDKWQHVEGNVYFPPDTVKKEYFSGTEHSTYCPWKGDASYYTIKADDGMFHPHSLGYMVKENG